LNKDVKDMKECPNGHFEQNNGWFYKIKNWKKNGVLLCNVELCLFFMNQLNALCKNLAYTCT
jgi:hypothetical protein